MKDKIEVNSKMLPLAMECWLHRSQAICFIALAFWTYSLVSGVLSLVGVSVIHPRTDSFFILGYLIGIWLFATLGKSCKQPLERLFYSIGILDFIIRGACGVIPASGAGIWLCQFPNIALSAIEIALSGAIVLWHFSMRTSRSDSQT